jgi:aspartyl/asparaginyl beta-hydroxylase (cupin superfamily)
MSRGNKLRQLKSKEPFNFKLLGNIDITEILERLDTFTEEEWTVESYRSQTFTVHRDTHALNILFDKDSLTGKLSGKKNEVNYNKLDFDSIKKSLLPIYEKHYGPGEIVRALIPRLKPGGLITPHRDGGEALMTCKRTHIALITNKDILFKVKDSEKNLLPGEVWEINNARRHSVENNSKDYRVHLIVDYVPK